MSRQQKWQKTLSIVFAVTAHPGHSTDPGSDLGKCWADIVFLDGTFAQTPYYDLGTRPVLELQSDGTFQNKGAAVHPPTFLNGCNYPKITGGKIVKELEVKALSLSMPVDVFKDR